MNQDAIKAMLLDIEDSKTDFTVTLTGKESKKVNGLYKSDTREILLHNKNFKTDNQLTYTAIHEYTHHRINEDRDGLPYAARVHTGDFWARFHTLLEKAEEKGLYTIELDSSPELESLTKEIKENYLARNGQLMVEFGKLLARAHELCSAANIRYEDYIDRVLRLPRTAARAIGRVSTLGADPSIGFENMKALAAIPNGEKRTEAQNLMLQGKSPDSVRALVKKPAETDKKIMLEKEKQRLERTINQLQTRLEKIQEHLAVL